MGIIVFCLGFGLLLGELGQEGKVMTDFFSILNDVVMRMVELIMWWVFTYAALMMARQTSNLGQLLTNLCKIGILPSELCHSLLGELCRLETWAPPWVNLECTWSLSLLVWRSMRWSLCQPSTSLWLARIHGPSLKACYKLGSRLWELRAGESQWGKDEILMVRNCDWVSSYNKKTWFKNYM